MLDEQSVSGDSEESGHEECEDEHILDLTCDASLSFSRPTFTAASVSIHVPLVPQFSVFEYAFSIAFLTWMKLLTTVLALLRYFKPHQYRLS